MNFSIIYTSIYEHSFYGCVYSLSIYLKCLIAECDEESIIVSSADSPLVTVGGSNLLFDNPEDVLLGAGDSIIILQGGNLNITPSVS